MADHLAEVSGKLDSFFTVLLAAMPMMAICYALGGLSRSDITVAAVLLIVTCLQLGALTMVGSALRRSTAMAFFTSLAVGFFYSCVPQVVTEVWNELTPGYIRPDFALGYWFLPQNHFSGQGTCNWGFVTVPVAVSWIPAAMTVPLLLGVARYFLERDAQAQVVRLVRAFLTRQQKRIRPSIKSGVRKIFGRFKPSSLPEDEPIAWRETSRVFYGRKDVMVGLAIVFALVVLGIMGIGLLDGIYGVYHWQWVTLSDLIQLHIDELVIMEAWIWGIGTGLLLIRGVTAFLTDRMRQSLPVLMTTPMAGREIVLQKVKAMHGLMCALAVPLAIVMSVRILWCGASIGLVYLLSLSATTCILIYGPMFAWVGLWMGLRCRNFLVAMTVTTAVVGVWFFLPLACWVVFIFGYSGTPGEIAAALISLISPAAWVVVLMVGDHEGVTAGQFLLVHSSTP